MADPTPTDLFGEPIKPRTERRGRKKYQKLESDQELVCLLVAASWSQARIARYIGCDEKTLRKYYSRELNEGADLIEGKALEVLLRKMKGGENRSVHKLLDVIDENRATDKAPEPKPEPKPGKKEQAEIDASDASQNSSWADDLAKAQRLN